MGELFDEAKVVGNEENGGLLFAEFFKFADTAVGEDGVADGEGFIDDKDLGIDVDGGGEGEADIHAAGILFNGTVDVIADFGESFDRLHVTEHLGARDTKDLAVDEDVFAAGEVGVEASSKFEERGEASARDHSAGGGAQDSGDDLEEGTLTAAVRAHETHDLAAFDGERYIPQGPEIGVEGFALKRI